MLNYICIDVNELSLKKKEQLLTTKTTKESKISSVSVVVPHVSVYTNLCGARPCQPTVCVTCHGDIVLRYV